MKKFIALLALTALIVTCCSGCALMEKMERAETTAEYRVLSIYSGEGIRTFESAYDLDFDGVDDTIALKIQDSNDNLWDGGEIMTLSVGAYEREVDSFGAELVQAYILDLDLNDGAMDIAVFTVEGSSDPVLRIFRYAEELPMWEFSCYNVWEEKWETNQTHWIGYASGYELQLDAYGTLKVEEQTDSVGMWSVYKTYKPENGVLKENRINKYEILPDFMDRDYYKSEMDAEEYAMWEKGYIKAYKAYSNDEISIAEGTYFKVLYDNGDNSVFIETADGDSAWINIDYEVFDRDINPHYFYLAG